MARSEKADEIMDLAERYMRDVGYNGFSFRDLADDAGIRTASVHYHFPTKRHLVAALVRRYTDRFLATIGDPSDASRPPDAALATYTGIFRDALADDRRMCVCGMLGAEFSALPEEVQQEVRRFFEVNKRWLAAVVVRVTGAGVLSPMDVESRAELIVAAMEGAMIVARSAEDVTLFDRIVGELARSGVLPRQTGG